MQLRIEVLSYKGQPPSESVSILFDEKGGSIGRSPDNDLCLNDPIVSSNHASISFEQSAFFITDHSTNGTFFLNTDRELRGEKVRLTDGDRLELGDHVVQICITEYGDNPLKPQATTTFPDLESQFEFRASEGTKERDREALPSFGPPDPIEMSLPPVFDQDLTPEHHLNPPSVSLNASVDVSEYPQESAASFPSDFNAEDLLKPLDVPDPPETKIEGTPSIPKTPPPPPPPPPKTDSENDPSFSDKTMPLDDFQPESTAFSNAPSLTQLDKEEAPEADVLINETAPEKLDALAPETASENADKKLKESDPKKTDVLTEEVYLQEPTLRVETPPPPPPHPEPVSIQTETPETDYADAEKKVPLPPDDTKGDEALIKILFDSIGLIYKKEMNQRESAELIKLTGLVLKELTEGLRRLLRARAEGKLEMGMMVTLIERQGNNPLKFCPTVEDALKLMLIDKNSGFMDAVSTVRESYEDVESHQMALNAGVQATLKDLLFRLDPKGIEKKFEKNVLRKKGRCWDEYNSLYQTVVKEMHEKFFDKEFARAYKDIISKIDNAQKNRQKPNLEETDRHE